MPRPSRSRLSLPRGFRSDEAALFVAMLEDLTARLRADLRGVTPSALAWQPRRGANTIGMLLAHLAVVEVWWSVGVLERRGAGTPFERVLGIGMDGDGMPLPARALPPASLAGRRLPYFLGLLRRGRAEVRRVAAALGSHDLLRPFRRRRRDGREEVVDPRWVLHHLVEHFAGHYGQILLLRHLHRATRGAPAPPLRRAG
jgi:hypothetical protein